MESKAVTKYINMSATKIRLVANEIRGMEFPDAIDLLRAIPKAGAGILYKTVMSAAANAKIKNPDINESDLFLKKLVVDEAPVMKRFRPRARGRASRIRKRNSHITVILSDD